MSIERIGDKYQIDGNPEVLRDNPSEIQEEISLFESEKAEEINDYETEFGQFNNETESTEIEPAETTLQEELIEILNNLINEYERKLNEVKDNNGVIAKGWDWIKNKTGIGAGSDKIQKQIDELREEIAGLKEHPEKLAEVYKDITGNELNEEELMKLADGTADFSKSEIVESVSKYAQGQKQCVNVISGIASGLAVVGMLALAPFTGGLSLAGLGAATLVGTAAYMVPQAVDGLTEKDGYSPKEIAQDIANGVINSGFTALGMGAGKAIGKIAGKTVTSGAGKFFANLAARETTSVIIGDGISVGNYITDVAFDEDKEFLAEDFGRVAVTSTAASITAGAVSLGVSGTVRPILTTGDTVSSQIAGRLISSGITGLAAGGSAAATAGSTNYIYGCVVNGQDVEFEEWLNATTENMASGALTGFVGGVAFEAVNLASGTPKPEGTVKARSGVTEDGIKYTDYLDKEGNLIARDVSASSLREAMALKGGNEEGITVYNQESSNGAFDTTRTIRVTLTNLGNGYYAGDMTMYDWADRTVYAGRGLVSEGDIPKPEVNRDYIETEFVEDGTPETTQGNTMGTGALPEGKEALPEGKVNTEETSVLINVEDRTTEVVQVNVEAAQVQEVSSSDTTEAVVGAQLSANMTSGSVNANKPASFGTLTQKVTIKPEGLEVLSTQAESDTVEETSVEGAPTEAALVESTEAAPVEELPVEEKPQTPTTSSEKPVPFEAKLAALKSKLEKLGSDNSSKSKIKKGIFARVARVVGKNKDAQAPAPRYSDSAKNKILNHATSDNINTINKIIDSVNIDGSPRFNENEVVSIVENMNADNIDTINKIIDNISTVKIDGTPKYTLSQVAQIARLIKADTMGVVEKLCNEDIDAFSLNGILSKLESEPDFVNSLDIILSCKNADGSLRFNAEEIYYNSDGNVQFISKRKDFFNELAAKENNGKPRFNYEEILNLLPYVIADNKQYFEVLCDRKNADGAPAFNGKNIATLLAWRNTDKEQLFYKFYEKGYSADEAICFAIYNKQFPAVLNLIDEGIVIPGTYDCLNTLQRALNIENEDIQGRIKINEEISEIISVLSQNKNINEKTINYFDSLKLKIETSLKRVIATITVSSEDTKIMYREFFANNDLELETALRTFDFSQYGKEGIPLEYSRKAFLKDLTTYMSKLTPDQRTETAQKLGITLIEKNGEIIGYDGIIDLTQIDTDSELYDIAYKFIKGNSVHTGNETIDRALNALIQGMPEFINVIGKLQNEGHAYSVDVHMLKVLQSAMSNESYAQLSGSSKTVLKNAAIMHDIAKAEGVDYKEHPQLSALYARDILNRYNLPQTMQNRIIETVKNHHWVENYAKGVDKATLMAQQRRPEDRAIYEILAQADAQNVSATFYDAEKANNLESAISEVRTMASQMDQNGQLALTSKIIRPDLIPTKEYKGKKFRVLDLTQMDPDTDLEQYGFTPGTTPRNIRALAHMVQKMKKLVTANILSDATFSGLLSAKYLSLNDINTYQNLKFGVILEAEQSNIISASTGNQNSGREKNFNNLVKILKDNSDRNRVPDAIKQNLNLTDSEYAQLYRQVANFKYDSQFKEDMTFTVGEKTFTGTQVRDAIIKGADATLSGYQNEWTVYTPKINAFLALVKSFEHIPQQYLDFIWNNNNLPIIIM